MHRPGHAVPAGPAAHAPLLVVQADGEGALATFIDHWALLSRALCGRLLTLLARAREGDFASHQALSAAVADILPHLHRLHEDAQAELRRQAFSRHLLDEVLQSRERLRAELNQTRADVLKERQLAMHDALTALPNRRAFMDILAQMLAEPGPRGVALMMLDLDGFKQVNDAHGHETGDRVLRIVAARLARTVRKLDVVGRMGGDEFTCLLREAPARDVLAAVALKLGEAVAAPITLNGATLSVRVSVGIVTCCAPGTGADALLAHADAAMYRAKRAHCGHAFADEPAPLGLRPLVESPDAAPRAHALAEAADVADVADVADDPAQASRPPRPTAHPGHRPALPRGADAGPPTPA